MIDIEERRDRFPVMDAPDRLAEQRRDRHDLDASAEIVDDRNRIGGDQLLDLRRGEQFLLAGIRSACSAKRPA